MVLSDRWSHDTVTTGSSVVALTSGRIMADLLLGSYLYKNVIMFHENNTYSVYYLQWVENYVLTLHGNSYQDPDVISLAPAPHTDIQR